MRRESKRTTAGLARLVGVVVGLQVAPAHAQPTLSDAALAEQLFEDAKRLMEARNYGEACPKFAESHRLDPAGGTILLLAQCHEAQGKTATAWAGYKEALARAKEAGNGRRERIARERIAALEPALSMLTIHVPAEVARLPGFRLLRAGLALGPVTWGTAMVVDPGFHEIQASADGHEGWSQRVEIGPRADRASLAVPPLRPRPVAAPPASSSPAVASAVPAASSAASAAPAAPPPPPLPSVDRRPAIVALGLGAVGLGLGVYFGLRSFDGARFASDRCPEKACDDAEAVRRGNDAVREANASNLAFGLGLLATGAGAYLWFSAPSAPRSSRFFWSPSVAPGYVSVNSKVLW